MSLRDLPSVERVLSHERLAPLSERFRRDWLTNLVRQRLDEARNAIRSGKSNPTLDELASSVAQRAERLGRAWPQPVINATGVVLHTNLGRAPLSAEAVEAVERAAQGYSNLEFELETGERGSRQARIGPLLCQLTGAEAAIAVNNNASAVLLGLATVATGREVIVSRGEAVEIGGGFRIPDVMRQSGAALVEVGTTNRTYVHDYEAACTERTAALLKVHASNFRVSGFTAAATLEELSELAHRKGLLLLHDLGSGCLLDTSVYGLAHEPTPQESVAAGADLVFFSGDKLLGGPQAGIVVGKAEAVRRLARHPLARAVRLDKLTLAALTATLLHYLRGEPEKIPIWGMISAPLDELSRRAEAWRKAIGGRASVADGLSTIGGGSLPGETLPTRLVALDCAGVDGGADGLAARLRAQEPPIVARIEEERVVLDPRTVLVGEEAALLEGVNAALRGTPAA